MSNLTYLGRVTIKASLVVKTGLHIGAGKDAIEIGGIDNPVVKHPHTQRPYVPGSSLKGKVRFLLEWAFNKVRADGKAFGFSDEDAKSLAGGGDVILRLFGAAASREVWDKGPSRLIVRDAPLNDEWAISILDQGQAWTEEKAEVSIDRIAGRALDGGLRHTERVPAGARFDAEFGFRLWATDDKGERDRECLAWFIQGLDLIEQDALGGSGTRGYGQVRFEDLQLIGMDGQAHNLDNIFRGERFGSTTPPKAILDIVRAATQPQEQAA